MKQLLLLLMFSFAFAIDASDTIELADVLPYNDRVIESGACEFKCRSVAKGYGTQITGIDFKNGITYCNVFPLNNHDAILSNMNANQENKVCAQEIAGNTVAENEIAGGVDKSYRFNPIQYNQNELTLSRFFGAMATLDPEIVDFKATQETGQLMLRSGVQLKGQIGGLFEKNWGASLGQSDTKKPLTDGVAVSTADAFNKANLAYFAGLFRNMQEIYNYLQFLLFVVVGAYFLSAIGAKKVQTYLERHNEPAPREPYLHRFYVPLLATAFFFAPIQNNEGMTSTVIQNIIRYFTTQSIAIADQAAAIGTSTYMQKLYGTVGAMSLEGELYTIKTRKDSLAENRAAARVFEQTCKVRYPNADFSKRDSNQHESFDVNRIAGSERDISLGACYAVANTIVQSKRTYENMKQMEQAYQQYYNNGRLKTSLERINVFMQNRQDELGWINATIVPGSGIMVELQSLITDNKVQPGAEEIANRNKEIAQQNAKDGERDFDRKKALALVSPQAAIVAELSSYALAYASENLAYMSLPGAGTMLNIVKDLIVGFGNVPIIGGLLGIAGTGLGFVTTTWLFSTMLQYIPILIATVAAAIAFVSYLIALLKYFYISPFVIAFSLTTKRLDKIVEFLINGFVIFFQPILIVVFIFLALFVYVVVQEFFIVFSVEQFGALELGAADWSAGFAIGAIKGFLKLFSSLASAYVLWKLILSGPSWALKLVGIDGSHAEMIAQNLGQKLEHRSLMA